MVYRVFVEKFGKIIREFYVDDYEEMNTIFDYLRDKYAPVDNSTLFSDYVTGIEIISAKPIHVNHYCYRVTVTMMTDLMMEDIRYHIHDAFPWHDEDIQEPKILGEIVRNNVRMIELCVVCDSVKDVETCVKDALRNILT